MKKCLSLALCAGLVVLGGCSGEPATPPAASGVDGSKYLAASEPEGAAGVIEVRARAKDGDDVVVVGRIGGQSPWVEGQAAFTIVDPSLKSCLECGSHDCPTPWDYC